MGCDSMSGRTKHYFACANTAKGFQNMFGSNLSYIGKVYILKGGPGNGKSTLMKRIGKYFEKKDFDVEYIHCSADDDSLDGVIIRQLSVAVVDGTAPHVIEPSCPGCIEEYVNVGAAWDTAKLKAVQVKIKQLLRENSECYPKVYEKFAEAFKIHDEWEKIYITNMDFEKANELSDSVAEEIIDGRQFHKESKVYHRFFGGTTCNGPVNYVENIIAPVSRKYYIKGRPGSGKSTLLKKLVVKAKQSGIDAEVYHCSFDPNSLDMVLLPELDCVIFDSTAPHEYYPNSNSDTLMDMYEELIVPGTDEDYEKQIDDIKNRYQVKIKEGVSYLKKAKKIHDEIENYYIKTTDFSVVERITDALIGKIENQ